MPYNIYFFQSIYKLKRTENNTQKSDKTVTNHIIYNKSKIHVTIRNDISKHAKLAFDNKLFL